MTAASVSKLRWLRWPTGVLAVLLLATLLCEWLEWPFLQKPLERALANGLQREVSLGQDFGLRLFGSVKLRSDALHIGPQAGTPGPGFADARDARLVLPYATVLALKRGERDAPLVVHTLDVAHLELNLERDADGVANWQFGRRDAPRDTDKRAPSLPRFETLLVRDGEIRFKDAISELDFVASVRTREGSAVAAAARPTTPADSAPAGSSAAGLLIEARGRYRDAPLTARLESSGVLPIASSSAQSPPVPMTLRVASGQTRIELDGSTRDVLRLAALDARFLIEGPSLAAVGSVIGATLPTTAPFGMRGRVRKDGPLWRADVERLVAGESRLKGSFSYDTGPEVPVLKGKLAGAHLALADLAPAFGAKPPQQAKPKSARDKSERLLPQREFHLPALGAMNADVELALDSVDLGSAAVRGFAPLHGHLRLQDQVLTVRELVARTSGGELRGTFSIDARSLQKPQWQADLRWSGVRLERFVKARNPRIDKDGKDAKKLAAAKGEQPVAPGYVSGVMGGSAKLSGGGRSIAALAGSLDGSLQAWVADGQVSHLLVELSGIDLAESLGLVIGGDEMLAVRCAVTRVVIKDGMLQPEVGVIDTTDATVLVGGQASLAEEQLALKLTAKPKDVSLVALRGPVTLAGSFAKPDVQVDKGRMALKIGAAAVLAAVTPLAALLPLIDLGEPQRAVCGEALKGLQGAAPKRLAKEAAAGG